MTHFHSTLKFWMTAALPQVMGGTVTVTLEGERRVVGQGVELYGEGEDQRLSPATEVVLVPYHQWGNRRPGREMLAWLREDRNQP